MKFFDYILVRHPALGQRGRVFCEVRAGEIEEAAAKQLELELPPGATAGDVLGHVQALPGAERLPKQPLLAVNERYARRDRVLEAGDEVAIIPPVAGG